MNAPQSLINDRIKYKLIAQIPRCPNTYGIADAARRPRDRRDLLGKRREIEAAQWTTAVQPTNRPTHGA
jgi:hypothetical protein